MERPFGETGSITELLPIGKDLSKNPEGAQARGSSVMAGLVTVAHGRPVLIIEIEI
jgi:hypothetical protein